jgi:hypothetical protein
MTLAAIVFWLDRWKIALAMASGIVLRWACYYYRKGYWMDEIALASNFQKPSPIDMFGPLLREQLAPPGFLVCGWFLEHGFPNQPQFLRLLPLVGAIVGMFLFVAVARRFLRSHAVFLAVVIFAFSNRLIYYASEFKQYSTDVTSALACLWMGLTIGSKPLTISRTVGLGIFGAAIVWFSHPVVFVLASVGLVGLARSIAAKDWRSSGLWLAVGLAWLVSFAGVHTVATRQLGGSGQMWIFWNFAFPPLPPGSLWDATWVLRRLAYFFINPLDFDAPFDPRLMMLPAIGLAIVGTVRLWRVDRLRWALLFLPVGVTLAASAFRLYPFHGRVILFLVPIPILAIAAGLDAVRELTGRIRWPLYGVLTAMVLVLPAILAVDMAFDQRWGHNHLGDLHPADIDPYRFPLGPEPLPLKRSKPGEVGVHRQADPL